MFSVASGCTVAGRTFSPAASTRYSSMYLRETVR